MLINLEKSNKNLQIFETKSKNFEKDLQKYSNFKNEIEDRERIIGELDNDN